MTPEQSLRAALLVKLLVDIEDWTDTIVENAGPGLEPHCYAYDIFSIDGVDFHKTPPKSGRPNETESMQFDGPLPIPMDLAREMLMWLKTRAEAELVSLGVEI